MTNRTLLMTEQHEKWDMWQGLLLFSQQWWGLLKKMRLGLFDVWWSWQVPVGCLLSSHFEYLPKYWAERGRDPLLPADFSMGSRQVLAGTFLPPWRPITDTHSVFLRVIGGFRYFMMEFLGFFFSFCWSWCRLVASCLSLILFWKVNGSRPLSDSSFPIVEMKGSWLALLTIYRWTTSHPLYHRSSCSLISGLEKLAGNILCTGDYWIIYWQAIGWHLFCCETNICLRVSKQSLLWTLMVFSPRVSSGFLERQIWCWKLQLKSHTQWIVGELLVTCPVPVS